MKPKLFTSILAATLCGAMCTSCDNAGDTPAVKADNDGMGHNVQDLEVFFDSISSRYMGSIMITEGDSTIYSKNVGYANIENGEAITDTTPFRIGSISKSFTAILTLKAIEAGKITMEDNLSKFFPKANIPNADKITLYHLLHHRSGLQDFINERYDEFLTYYKEEQSKEQMLERISKFSPNFEPGERISYSNTGYLLLAYIVEQVNAKSYADLIKEQIAEPLGLTHTFCCSSKRDFSTHSYKFVGEWRSDTVWAPSVDLGTGSIVSSTRDLQKYAYAIGTGSFGEYVYDQMTDFVDGYGCGIQGVKAEDGKINLGHQGRIESFNSMMMYEDGKVSTILENSEGININFIMWTIGCALKGEPFYIPDLNYIDLDSTRINEYVGEFVCGDHRLKFWNDGEHLVATDENDCSVFLEAKPNSFFQCYALDIDAEFNPTNDSVKYRIGGERRMYTKVK